MVFLSQNQKTYLLNMQPKKRQKKRQAYQKTGNKRARCTGKRKNRHRAGRLNRYDFYYAGKDTVNQVGKIAPNIIKQAAGQIDKRMQSRINQVIKSGRTEIERVLPKILRGAVEEVYKTPFRLLGNFG